MLIEPRFLKPTETQKERIKELVATGDLDMLYLWDVYQYKPGIYNGDHNFLINRQTLNREYAYKHAWNDDMPPYGFTDSYEQFVELFEQKLIDHPMPLCVFARTLNKQDDAGMCWRKNGRYYGVYEIEAEHFGDEPIIEQVFQFQVLCFENVVLDYVKFDMILNLVD